MKIINSVKGLFRESHTSDVVVSQNQMKNDTIGKCPKCGNTKIIFSRERLGTVSKSYSQKSFIGIGRTRQSTSQSAYRTVGLCQTCGYTWECDSGVPKTNSKNLWLWVLGWLFVFPIPLSILIIRKKQMNLIVKIAIIAIAWMLFFAIAGSDGKSESDIAISKTDRNIESVQSNRYADDDAINNFIIEFNDVSPYEIKDISKGNIRTKYFGYVNGRRLEMINAPEMFVLKINGGQEQADKESMYDVFRVAIKILDESITDEMIDLSLAEFDEREVLIEDYQLGDKTIITYVPLKELSYGNTTCRIDIRVTNL